MKTYTNNYIVEDVYRTYKVRKLITTMIDYSIKDKSCDDLQMYIYEILLTYDNIRLNQMYNDGKLRNFISQIIKRQRDGGTNSNTEYANYFHIKDTNEYFFEWHDIEDKKEYDITADLIIRYIDKKAEMIEGNIYTSYELKNILAFTILKKYFMSDLTQIKLAQHLNLSRSTITNLLKTAKDDILKFWNTKGKYLDENKIDI